MVILKWILEKQHEKVWNGFIGLRLIHQFLWIWSRNVMAA